MNHIAAILGIPCHRYTLVTWGEPPQAVVIDADSGDVVDRSGDHEGYFKNIERFDVEEWRQWKKDHDQNIEEDAQHPIKYDEFGYWYDNGSYHCPPFDT